MATQAPEVSPQLRQALDALQAARPYYAAVAPIRELLSYRPAALTAVTGTLSKPQPFIERPARAGVSL